MRMVIARLPSRVGVSPSVHTRKRSSASPADEIQRFRPDTT